MFKALAKGSKNGRRIAAVAMMALALPTATIATAPHADAKSNPTYAVLVQDAGSGDYLTAFGTSKSNALKNALRKSSGQPHLLTWAQNGCVAFAQNYNSDGWGAAHSKSKAFSMARSYAGRNASVTLWACAGNYAN